MKICRNSASRRRALLLTPIAAFILLGSFCGVWCCAAFQLRGDCSGASLRTRRFTAGTPRYYSTALSRDDDEDLLDDIDNDGRTASNNNVPNHHRRNILKTVALALAGQVGGIMLSTTTTAPTTDNNAPNGNVCWASGGATAGRYTTIPIAKRRYYGRVQQAVHDFLDMGTDVVKADMTASRIQTFFDAEGVVIVPAKNKDIKGQCTKKDNDCAGREIRDSRYNDMKASMYLLANAFRTDQQKPPDRLPTVKAAKAFFKEMNEMQALVTKRPKTNDPVAVGHYAAALDILEVYLDLVELPPTDSGHYDQEFDTMVGEMARIT